MLLCNSRSSIKYGSFYICFIDHCSCTLHRFYIGFHFHSGWLTYIHHRFSWRETVGIRGLHGKWLVITSIRDRLCATHQWWFIHLWLRICFAVLIYYDYYWYSSYILFHSIYFSVYPISTTCFFHLHALHSFIIIFSKHIIYIFSEFWSTANQVIRHWGNIDKTDICSCICLIIWSLLPHSWWSTVFFCHGFLILVH